MHLIIAKVDQVFYDGEAASVTLPGADGDLTVLSHHEPLITTLREGAIVVRASSLPGGEQQYPIQSGLLEVRDNRATVIL